MGLDSIMQDADYWKHPYTRLAFSEGTQQRLQTLMENTDLFCNLLEQLPQTISHQDTHWTNLFATHDANGRETTAVIDWSFLGLAAVGEDLGTQIAGNLANLFIDSAQAKIYYQAALDAYLDGLRETGWQGEKKSVQFASAATAFLRYATFELIMLRWMIMAKEKGEASWIDEMAQKQGLSVEETLQRWGRAITFLFDLGEEARDLASS